MKKRLNNPAFRAALFLVIYLLGLVFGASALSAYPYYYKQRNFFEGIAQIIAQEYLDGSTDFMYSSADSNLHIYLYDDQGNRLHHIKPLFIKEGTIAINLHEKYIPRVISGNKIYRLKLTNEMPRFTFDIVALSGVPIYDGDTVVGMLFFVKNLVDLPSMLAGYFIYFTVFYWLTIFFFITTSRKKKKLEQLQQNYIANITHALKTPIASIRALTEILCDDMEPDTNEQKLYYGMILTETSRQEHMVRDILELSKLQSNTMDFSKTSLDAQLVLSPVFEKYAALCDCSGIALHVSDSLSHLPPLYTNAACLKQLFEILLDNALKFVPEDGNIWIDALPSKNFVTLCVRDDGTGIAQNSLPYVFDRFYKGNHDFNVSGSGLGLAIAKEMIAGLNEQIWVESKPNEGAFFYFTIHFK